MFNNRKQKRKLIGIFLASVFMIGSFAFAVPAAQAETEASNPILAASEWVLESISGVCDGFLGNTCYAAALAIDTLWNDMLWPTMKFAFYNVILTTAENTINRIAYDAAVAIGSGGAGGQELIFKDDFFTTVENIGLYAAGDAVGALGESVQTTLDIDFDVCSPSDPILKLSFQLGIAGTYSQPQPRCDWRQVTENWEATINSLQDSVSNPSRSIQQLFAQGLRPGRNEISGGIQFMNNIGEEAFVESSSNALDRLIAEGFKAKKDPITGKIISPATNLREAFNEATVKSPSRSLDRRVNQAINNIDLSASVGSYFTSVLQMFTNTLLSTTLKTAYEGWFADDPTQVTPDLLSGIDFSPLNKRDAAIARFSSFNTTTSTANVNYNVLNDFSACPIGAGIVRGVNNCVLDSKFITAIYQEMTIAEAIEKELIDPTWPLISPEDQGKNQDPFCKDYGFCYGNLVKLRQARVIPVGWEIAARKSDSSNPITLGEAIDKFDECEGGDTTFCRLIDENWVLKYPAQQCEALVIGEQLIGAAAGARAGACVDAPSCIEEDENGNCIGGFGYCTQERNVWKFEGTSCPAQYESCLSFTNTGSGEQVNYMLNSVDFDGCGQGNAGCQWYRTNKFLDDKGNADPSDDEFVWNTGVVDSALWDTNTEGIDNRLDLATDAVSTGINAYYAHEDRLYLTHAAETCDEGSAGCTKVFKKTDTFRLNAVRNPSFEDDEAGDGNADHWDYIDAVDANYEKGGDALFGVSALDTLSGPGFISQDNIQVIPSAEHTLSFYVRSATPPNTSSIFAQVSLKRRDGSTAVTNGFASRGDCDVNTGFGFSMNKTLPSTNVDPNSFERFTCTFTTTPDTEIAQITFNGVDTRIDGVQLELGGIATDFIQGYSSSTPEDKHIRIAPDYLGCDGFNDPEECGNYAQACSAIDVGCNLYEPQDGDPSVPAIVSQFDECPAECIGYDTYKQESTNYEGEVFPAYFIPSSARECSASEVGCDAFTNLDTVAEGGEGVEYYTNLRACLEPEIAGSRSKTFFTWEGSDIEGYQLMTWQLLVSDLTGDIKYTEEIDGDPLTQPDAFDVNPELAPCVNWRLNSENNLICEDSLAANLVALEDDDGCNEHSDITDPNNADCREFFDDEGNIHYRRMSQTVTISDQCHPYRKSQSTQADCQATGGFFTAGAECRYFGLPEESEGCSASAEGCREYTGGAGRNSVTLLNEGFEGDNLSDNFMAPGTTTFFRSTESLAAPEGRSLALQGGAGAKIATIHGFTNANDPNEECVATDGCAGQNSGNYSNSCTVLEGNTVCGTLTDELVGGKVFTLQFWAKGNGGGEQLRAQFESGGGKSVLGNPFGTETLSTDWQLYALGPLDTSLPAFAGMDANTVLSFILPNGGEVFIDNIQLKQAQENITIIKDSWVTPASCDTDFSGGNAPQFFLGCEAYNDRTGEQVNIYQFSRVCSEEVIGCEAFYDTQNVHDAFDDNTFFGQTYNATCQYDLGNVTAQTACSVNGQTYCQINPGNDSCLFSINESIRTGVDASTNMRIVFGPETQIVEGDKPLYIVDNGQFDCASSVMGCEEVGLPTFTQDLASVESFESIYVLNRPAEYDAILCDHSELFCEEFATQTDGNYYFKNPLNHTCEWKTDIRVNGQESSGWFKAGTSEPCDPNFQIGGDVYGLWRNGDSQYDGWVGECPSSANSCTNFTDPTDSDNGNAPSGKPYFYLDNNTLDEAEQNTPATCDGQASQKLGCALFNDTTDPVLTSNASATYALSNRADVLIGQGDAFELVDPVSCPDNGVIDLPNGNGTVDLCAQRCEYSVIDASRQIENAILTPSIAAPDTRFYGDSCFDDSDCSPLRDSLGAAVFGRCTNLATTALDQSLTLKNDTNRVLGVKRDRECSQWLDCRSSQTIWNPEQGRFVEQCEEVDICSSYAEGAGGESFCTNWENTDPVVLSENVYKSRDISWTGVEFSGFSIPDKLPIQHFNQVNINPDQWCIDSTGRPHRTNLGLAYACSDDDFCQNDPTGPTDPNSVCKRSTPDYRLLHDGGDCSNTSTNGDSCRTGVCRDSGTLCAVDNECATGDACIHGYCQFKTSIDCNDDSQCGLDYPICDPLSKKCVNELVPNTRGCTIAADDSIVGCGAAPANIPFDTQANQIAEIQPLCTGLDSTKVGMCVEGQCLIGLDGQKPFISQADTLICRGYPEATSPVPVSVVDQWAYTDNKGRTINSVATDLAVNAKPESYIRGITNIHTCSPIFINEDGSTDGNREWVASGEYYEGTSAEESCLCSYTKMSYGGAVEKSYYPLNYQGPTLEGICVGGAKAGFACLQDSECNSGENSTGRCSRVDQIDTFIGWEGYCIERDTSTRLYGEQDQNFGTCTQWLPIDRAKGSTDLFAKAVGAGYTPQDTFYCADTSIRYSIGTNQADDYEDESRGDANEKNKPYACAEDTGGGNCPKATEVVSDESFCLVNSYCPPGHFIIIASCDSDDGTYLEGDTAACPSGNDDCPYICVPKASFHTKEEPLDVSGYAREKPQNLPHEQGSPCLPPNFSAAFDGTLYTSPIAATDERHDYDINLDGEPDSAYGVTGPQFWRALSHYNDCKVQGLTANEAQAYMGGTVDVEQAITYTGRRDGDFLSGIDPNLARDKEFRNLFIYIEPELVCETIVQTASEVGDTGNAWTQRAWDNASGDLVYSIQTDKNSLAYPSNIYLSDVGQALDINDYNASLDAYDLSAQEVLACERVQVGEKRKNGDRSGISRFLNFRAGWDTEVDWVRYDEGEEPWKTLYSRLTSPLFDPEFEGADNPDPDRDHLEKGSVWNNSRYNDHLSTTFPEQYSWLPFDPDEEGFSSFNQCVDPNKNWTPKQTIAYLIAMGRQPFGMKSLSIAQPSPRAFANTNILFAPSRNKANSGASAALTCSGIVNDDQCNTGITCDTGLGVCANGSYAGVTCEVDQDCWDHVCVPNYNNTDSECIPKTPYYFDRDVIADENRAKVKGRLSQIFARSTGLWRFDSGEAVQDIADKSPRGEIWNEYQNIGVMTDVLRRNDAYRDYFGGYVRDNDAYNSNDPDSWYWDVRPTGDDTSHPNLNNPEQPEAPKIWSIGSCLQPDVCEEGNEGKFSINGQDQNNINGRFGKHVEVEFFVTANKNQLPIKNVVMDWGDGRFENVAEADSWVRAFTGATDDNNFYKNYRGRVGPQSDISSNHDVQQGDLICSSRTDIDRLYHTESCEIDNYPKFVHDYVCTEQTVNSLIAKGRRCITTDDPVTGQRKIVNSPCTGEDDPADPNFIPGAEGSCVYQPRLHIRDNWGWCTGTCEADLSGEGTGCFDGGTPSKNECNIQDCPGNFPDCRPTNAGLTDPWIYYDGFIIMQK